MELIRLKVLLYFGCVSKYDVWTINNILHFLFVKIYESEGHISAFKRGNG